MGLNKQKDLSPAIRLQRLTGLPLPKDIADMSNESRRSKKRVELPWQPSGRPEPVILSASYDETTSKTSWVLYDGVKESAAIIWSSIGAEPPKVVQALKDWFTVARLAESWVAAADDAPTEPRVPQPSPAGFPKTDPLADVRAVSTPDGFSGEPDGLTPSAANSAPVAAGAPQPVSYPFGFATPAMPFPALPFQPGYAPPYPAAPGYAAAPVPPSWPYAQTYPTDPEMMAKQWAQSAFQRDNVVQAPPLPENNEYQSSAPGLMLGDVLVAAGIIPSKTLQAALTLQNASPLNRRLIGEILVSSGALPTTVLKAAITLQGMARNGSITRSRMSELLAKVHTSGVPVETLLAERTKTTSQSALESAVSKKIRPSDERLEREAEVNEEDRKKLKEVMTLVKRVDFSGEEGSARAQAILDLLVQSQLVTKQIVEDASKASGKPADVIKALLVKEHVHPITFEAASKCHQLVADNRMALGQAIIALGYCDRGRVPLADAFEEMGWDIKLDDASAPG